MTKGTSTRVRASMSCVVSLVMIALSVGCGSDDGSTSSSSSSSGTGQSSSGLSAAFGSNCARCHGPKGEGQGIYPRIPGTKDEPTFIAFVRTGKGEMPAFDSSTISDADLKADYAWMTTKR